LPISRTLLNSLVPSLAGVAIVKFKGSFVAGNGTAIAALHLLTQGVNEPPTSSGSSNLVGSSTDKHLDEGRLISKESHAMPRRRGQNSTASRPPDSVTCVQRKTDVASGEQQVRKRQLLPRTQVWTERYVDTPSELCGRILIALTTETTNRLCSSFYLLQLQLIPCP
jgi:hypothetical protein